MFALGRSAAQLTTTAAPSPPHTHITSWSIWTLSRVPTWYWKYWKSIELWNRFWRPWKGIEFGQNVHKASFFFKGKCWVPAGTRNGSLKHLKKPWHKVLKKYENHKFSYLFIHLFFCADGSSADIFFIMFHEWNFRKTKISDDNKSFFSFSIDKVLKKYWKCSFF